MRPLNLRQILHAARSVHGFIVPKLPVFPGCHCNYKSKFVCITLFLGSLAEGVLTDYPACGNGRNDPSTSLDLYSPHWHLRGSLIPVCPSFRAVKNFKEIFMNKTNMTLRLSCRGGPLGLPFLRERMGRTINLRETSYHPPWHSCGSVVPRCVSFHAVMASPKSRLRLERQGESNPQPLQGSALPVELCRSVCKCPLPEGSPETRTP